MYYMRITNLKFSTQQWHEWASDSSVNWSKALSHSPQVNMPSLLLIAEMRKIV